MFLIFLFICISNVLTQYHGPPMPNTPSGYESINEDVDTPHMQAEVDDQLAYQLLTEEIEGMVIVPRPIVPVHDFPVTAKDIADEIVGRFGCSRTSFAKVQQYIKKSRPLLIGKAKAVSIILQMICKV